MTNNDKERVLALIKSGTPVDVADESGQTPLGQAVFLGRMDMVKLLLDNGALIDGVKVGVDHHSYRLRHGRKLNL